MTAAAGSARAALAHRPFRLLMVGQAASQGGDWLYNVALLALVFERTHSAAWVGATTVARVLPIVLLCPLGGLVAERVAARRLMIVSDLLRAAIMLGLVGVAVLGAPVVLVPVLAGLATAAGAAYPVCTALAVPRLVPDADLPGANAVRAALGPACIVGGPALGAVLLAAGSASLAIGLNALTFLVSAAAVARITIPPAPRRRPSPTPRPAVHPLHEITDGARALWVNRPALRMVGADLLCSFVYGSLTVALVLLAARDGHPGSGYGVLLGAVGVGGIAGSVLAGRLARRLSPAAVVALALVAVAAAVAALPVAPVLGVLLALCVVGGAGSTVVEVHVETTLQRTLDPQVFARAYGFAFPAAVAGIVVGAAVATPLIAAVGLGPALGLIGAVTLLSAAGLHRGATAGQRPAASLSHAAVAPAPAGG